MTLAKPRVSLPPAENAARIGMAIDAIAANTAGLAREVALRTAEATTEAEARRAADRALAQEIAAAAQNAADALRREVAVREAGEAGLRDETGRALATAAIRVDALATPTRPGDSPDAFTHALTGGAPAALPALPEDIAATTERGFVARLYGADIVAARRAVAIELGRTYRLRAVVQRRADAIDPDNDAVRIALQWLNGALQPIAGRDGVVRDVLDLTTAAGRRIVMATAALVAAPGIDRVAPEGTAYARPYVQTFGGRQITDVEVIALDDLTDALAYAPDVASFEARLAAQESLQAGSRLDSVERAIGQPQRLTVPTLTAARAARVPAAIAILDVLGYDTPGIGAQTYRRATATAPAPGLIRTADGAWWSITAVTMTAPMFGADPTGNHDSAAALGEAQAALPPGQILTLTPGTYRLGADIDMEGRLIDASGASLSGPGRITNALFTRALPSGVLAIGGNRGDVHQGLQIAGGKPEDGPAGNVLRAEGHATWSGFFPSRDLASTELAVHTTAATGEATAQAGTADIVWTRRGREPSPSWVGRRLWFNDAVYRVARVAGNTIALTRPDGSPFTFGAAVTEVFFVLYVYGTGRCQVTGKTVTRRVGDPFVLYDDDPSFEFRIDGTTRKVVGFTDSFTLALGDAPGDRTDALYEFFLDVNDGQLSTFRLHRSEVDAENLSIYVRPDGAWIHSQYGGYGRYRPITLTTGELNFSPGSAIRQVVLRPEALLLGGDYGWDALRILMPQHQPANFLLTQAALPGEAVGFAARGTDSDIGFFLDVKGHAPIVFSAGAFGSIAAKFIPMPGAVAFPEILNAPTGGRVTLSAASDNHADAGLLLSGRGTGGTMIEAAIDGALGFFGTPPAAKQPGPDIQTVGISQLADIIDAVNQLRAALVAYGLIH